MDVMPGNVRFDCAGPCMHTIRYITLRQVKLHFITLHHVTSRYITLHWITLHYITIHYVTSCCILYFTFHSLDNIHTFHYICIGLHHITLHYIALHCVALHCTILHYTALHYIIYMTVQHSTLHTYVICICSYSYACVYLQICTHVYTSLGMYNV